MDKVQFTRADLYNLVWKFPIAQIAKHYDISSISIKDACHKMQIPLPGSRQLLRLKNNKSSIPKLNEDYQGSNQIGILRKTYESRLRRIANLTPLLKLIKTIEDDPHAPVHVPKRISRPSAVIRKTQSYWQNKESSSWNQNDLKEVLYLNVEIKNIPRALLFMDALIKLLQYRGHSFEKNTDKTGVVLIHKEIEIEIDLREGLKRIPPKIFQETSQYISTGVLIVQIRKDSYKKEWRDGRSSLESSLVSIVANLELIAAEEKQWREDCGINSGES
ncbi:hypothetical protein AAEO57_10065 [Flavobacterium sp. DGU38]|uniref:Uncharacterized protein n=1 Tax=Flavobacterium calami TaxID=3139144 RepID=A0ABU9IP08_9FLAO